MRKGIGFQYFNCKQLYNVFQLKGDGITIIFVMFVTLCARKLGNLHLQEPKKIYALVVCVFSKVYMSDTSFVSGLPAKFPFYSQLSCIVCTFTFSNVIAALRTSMDSSISVQSVKKLLCTNNLFHILLRWTLSLKKIRSNHLWFWFSNSWMFKIINFSQTRPTY